MSGNNPMPFIMPITLRTIPPEGSTMVYTRVNWQNTNTGIVGLENISLLNAFQSGRFTTCQSVFIDNSTCNYEVWLKCNETQLTLLCPPYTQGMFPLPCSASPTFVVTLLYQADPVSGNAQTNITTSFYFFNTYQEPYINSLPVYGNSYNNANGQLTFTAKNTIQQILPALGQFSQYIITSITLTIYLEATISNAAYGEFLTLCEMGTAINGGSPSASSWIRFQQSWSATNTQTGILVQSNYNFNPGLQTSNNNVSKSNGLGLYISVSDAVGIEVAYQIVYGTVILT